MIILDQSFKLKISEQFWACGVAGIRREARERKEKTRRRRSSRPGRTRPRRRWRNLQRWIIPVTWREQPSEFHFLSWRGKSLWTCWDIKNRTWSHSGDVKVGPDWPELPKPELPVCRGLWWRGQSYSLLRNQGEAEEGPDDGEDPSVRPGQEGEAEGADPRRARGVWLSV